MILPIQISSLLRCSQTLFSPIPLLKLSALLSSFFAIALAQPPKQPPAELLIAAASDLIAVQAPLSDAWAALSDHRLRFTSGASGMLAQQIASGAPYDLFLSADEVRVKELVASGDLIKDTVVEYARGRLGLWSRGRRIGALGDLLAPAVLHIAIANPVHAPYGAAARQALEKSGLWPQLAGKIVYAETVRQALEYGESGNAEAAIVAWSLVSDRGGVLLPANLHSPIRQTGAVVKTSKNQEAARYFLRFLTSPEGRRLLESHGFTK
jgi:molybdate transport system substrate-binding protein